MSKSLGNILLVKDLLAEASGEAIRLAMLSTHYHQPLSWSADKLYQACTNLDYLYGTLRHVSDIPAGDCRVPDEILAALGDDLNTPEAIAGLLAIAKEANKTRSPEAKGRLLAAAELLGLLSESHDLWFECSLEPGLREQVEDLIERRRQARQDKDFATADRLRADLNQLGVILEDTPEGTRWHLGS
jgi:cysteinyl-tRNA synthetase